ncbi:hypothetical protein RUM44_008968 [Polyplax serrata]|uniref:Solute carrier organic anion transporter family member n=1 Tax=Polyplax serrata TaxID=468196 RepID=A0ABR1ARE8_POLSC
MKYFMIVYGLLGTIQAMSFVYFVATLTTLEKRFQIRSEITGVLMSGNEMSQIFLSMFLAYKGGKGNRPVWMAWGVLFSSLSCFILALPHFIYGPGSTALALTKEFTDVDLASTVILTNFQDSNPMLCSKNRTENKVNEECLVESAENPLLSLFIIFFSQFVLGVGTTLYVTLGQPYLDDNTKRKNTPKLLGMTMALRSVGPAGGFILGFLCLNSYIDPSLTPIIDRSDPRWMGAWWLGNKFCTDYCISNSKCQIKPKATNYAYQSVATGHNKSFDMEITRPVNNRQGIFGDFKKAFKRVATNPLLIANNLTAVFYILGASGYINFYAKYAEVQYHQSAAFSSMIAGVSTVISIVVGFMAAGFLITKFKPRESYLLMFNVFIAVAYMVGELGFLFLNCTGGYVSQGNEARDDNITVPLDSCSADCSCQLIGYSPVCFEKGDQSFFSPCHAGCTQMGEGTYSNCSCLPEPTDIVRQGPCRVNCMSTFVIFVAIQCLIQMIGCSGRITNVLINYRAVEAKDKPLAQGLCLFMISLLAFIPGPIIYGRVIDSSCTVWDNKCGYRGNCWLYDKDLFRTYLNVTALCFTFGAFVFDIVVYHLARNIRLYDDEASDGLKT